MLRSTEKIKIIIVDDHKTFRQGLASILSDEKIETIAEAQNGQELLTMLEVEGLCPDVIMLDLQMPGMDGKETLTRLRKKYPAFKVIILSQHQDNSITNQLRLLGANSFISKNTDSKLIAETIRNVYFINTYNNIPKKVKTTFTKVEIELIPYIMSGKTIKETAELTGRSVKTIEGYRNRLFAKTKTSSAVTFAAFCAKEGLDFLGGEG